METIMSGIMKKPDPSSLLLIPELLYIIFENLEGDTKTLRSILQVNRTWLECGSSIAWKTTRASSLAKAEDNRALYASKIQRIDFCGNEPCRFHKLFEDLEFNNLRAVSVDAFKPDTNTAGFYLQPYLRPTLESATFYGCRLDGQFLTELQKECGRLRMLLLDSTADNLTSEQLLTFLESCSSLKKITFLYLTAAVINDDIIVHLASRPDLTALSMMTAIQDPVTERIVESIPTPFKSITSLTIHSTTPSLRLLVPHLSAITSLELTVTDDGDPVLELVSSLLNLQRLSVNYNARINLTCDELLSLKNLTQLESLSLNHIDDDITYLDCFQFTNDHFEILLSKLPRLERLILAVQCMLTSAALKMVAKYCPLINTLQLLVPINTLAIQPDPDEEGPLLSELKELELAGFERPAEVLIDSDEEIKAAKTIATRMVEQFPSLRGLIFMDEDVFSDLVAEEVAGLLGLHPMFLYGEEDDQELIDEDTAMSDSIAVEELDAGNENEGQNHDEEEGTEIVEVDAIEW